MTLSRIVLVSLRGAFSQINDTFFDEDEDDDDDGGVVDLEDGNILALLLAFAVASFEFTVIGAVGASLEEKGGALLFLFVVETAYGLLSIHDMFSSRSKLWNRLLTRPCAALPVIIYSMVVGRWGVRCAKIHNRGLAQL